MKYQFWKYQGTGNDFIFFDGREDLTAIKDNQAVIARLCDRKFGIGADGLIIIEEDRKKDFRMIYYNADGAPTSMCGNGGRCSIAFANWKLFSGKETQFVAIDGPHDGLIKENGWVDLGMIDVRNISRISDNVFVLDTGSPHYVYFVEAGEEKDIIEFGKSIRYSDEYQEKGINVNLVWIQKGVIKVRTYERGVEDETLSCGTGVTACAIAFNEYVLGAEKEKVAIEAEGGNLEVSFRKNGDVYTDIVLGGPVKMVFQGEIDL